jgi:hypothetical protein
MILRIEMCLQIIQSLNKLKYFLSHCCESFNAICIIKVREHNNYNINQGFQYRTIHDTNRTIRYDTKG